MGTRADFYIGRGAKAEWLGSVAMDGYPDGMKPALLRAKTEIGFRRAVTAMLKGRDDATTPDLGWPWPWEDSRTTDYAYAFDKGAVYGSCFGRAWFPAAEAEPEDDSPKSAKFPNMSGRAKPAAPGTKRSGLLVFTVREKGR